MASIALLGGSFDPPHIGHLASAKWVLQHGDVDRVWLLPVFRHGFGKNLSPFKDRMKMTELLVKNLSGAEVSDLESKVGGDGSTVHMLEFAIERWPQHKFRFAGGTDLLKDFHRWKDPERIKTIAPLIVIPRAGYGPSTLPEVSSSQVRTALNAGQDVSAWLPAPVEKYIRQHGLYGVNPKPQDVTTAPLSPEMAGMRERMESLLSCLA